MRILIKSLLWLIAATSALLATLVVMLVFVDVNVYRTQIEGHVSAVFGRKVILEGPLRLDPSLTPRFVVNGLKISNPDWASRPFLATVDKFDIRVSLLPLLSGELKIVGLEFHGVDLLLEEVSTGINNFTFGSSGEATILPTIEHMSLYNAAIAYNGPDGMVKSVYAEKVTARNVPGQSVELNAHTNIHAVPVTVSLRGESQNYRQPDGPWQITVVGKTSGLSLQVAGTVAGPTSWRQGQYRFELKGDHLHELERLSGFTLPEAESIDLKAELGFDLDQYLTVSQLSAQLGANEFHGQFHWDMAASRPAIRARFESQQLYATTDGSDALLTDRSNQKFAEYGDQLLDMSTLADFDLDARFQVERLDGLGKTVRNIAFTAKAENQQFRLVVENASVDDTQLAATATLPWGERLMTLVPAPVSLSALLQHTSLEVLARAPDAIYRYHTSLMGNPFDLAIATVEATVQPGERVMIQAGAVLNNEPVILSLQGEPFDVLLQHPGGPWQQLEFEVRGSDIRLEASGSVARPFEGEGFNVRYAMSGPDIDFLLPLQGAWSLAGYYADHPDRHVFEQLKLTIDKSDIGGRLVLYHNEKRPRLVANLQSGRLHVDQILPQNPGGSATVAGLEQTFDIGPLGAFDLYGDLQVQQLEGAGKPVKNVRLTLHAGAQKLILAPLRATVEGVNIDARAQLPWGERLVALGKDGISALQLVQSGDLAFQAQAPEGQLRYHTAIMAHPVDLQMTGLEANGPPGEALEITATGRLNGTPVQARLRAGSLAELLRHPAGPWQDLDLDVQVENVGFQANGRVERPFEVGGFDIRFTLRGAEIETILPVLNIILPMQGAYSLSGHFADLPDRSIFDELKIVSSNSDIGGSISVYHRAQRPRLVANLHSEQIYLRDLLPVSDTAAIAGANHRVIPDYELPIDRLRGFDGELHFKGKRLRTDAGDLGDLSFTVTLQDGLLKIDPFRVRGWAGAEVEFEGTIDASQEPPATNLRWVARQLDYGALLEQAGLAETVEGTVDITLHLSGYGSTRHEFLSDANGQLIIVGQEGRFGSRRLDLWGSGLVTTMLSRDWRSEDVTDINCMVARVRIEDGMAASDDLIVDTRRITIGAAGTLDLESEELNMVFAPSPKRTSLVSLTNPVHVTGTLAAPEVAVTMLPRRRMAAAGTGLLAGLVNPGYLIFTFSQAGSRHANACAVAIEQAEAMKGIQEEAGNAAAEPGPRYSLLPGCTRSRRQPDS